jgi:hypothetical protein
MTSFESLSGFFPAFEVGECESRDEVQIRGLLGGTLGEFGGFFPPGCVKRGACSCKPASVRKGILRKEGNIQRPYQA